VIRDKVMGVMGSGWEGDGRWVSRGGGGGTEGGGGGEGERSILLLRINCSQNSLFREKFVS